MGVFDWVVFEAGDETHGIRAGEMFQTKSLEPCMHRYTVKGDGTLRFKDGESIPYHGDVLLRRCEDREQYEFVARFTEGKLQWLQPLDSYHEVLNGFLAP